MTFEPAVIWLAVLGVLSAGLAYGQFVLLPAAKEARLAGAVRAFGRAVELRFPNHSGLTEEVARLARKVGAGLTLSPRRIRDLDLAVRLRDIGLCAIPYRLVNRKAWSDWSLSETATYDCHAEVGGAILETIPALIPYAQTVRCHHTPYLQSPIGDRVRTPNLDARIVKACAEFVWYSRHLGSSAAAQHLQEGAGTPYDPVVVRELIRHVEIKDRAPGIA